jgi:hypothetical protein
MTIDLGPQRIIAAQLHPILFATINCLGEFRHASAGQGGTHLYGLPSLRR